MLANSIVNTVAGSPIRLCQIEDQQKNLQTQCDSLSNAIDALDQRLCHVVRPCPPEPATNAKSVPHEMLVPVAEEYYNRAEQVRLMQHRIGSILERLELP